MILSFAWCALMLIFLAIGWYRLQRLLVTASVVVGGSAILLFVYIQWIAVTSGDEGDTAAYVAALASFFLIPAAGLPILIGWAAFIDRSKQVSRQRDLFE